MNFHALFEAVADAYFALQHCITANVADANQS
jgi:hypothetical protein